MKTNSPEEATYEDALKNHQALEKSMANELGAEEISDPTHLSQEEQDMIARISKAAQAGVDPENDPITRGLVNGHILKAIGEDMSEPGYDEKETSEASEYINKLTDGQYEGTMGTLKTFNLCDPEQPQEGDVPVPTLEQTKEILASQLTPEQLEAVRNMEKPTLQLIPVTSMSRYIKALDSYKPMDNQADAYVSFWHRDAFKRADKRDGVANNNIINWRIAVTDDAKEPKILPGDDIEETLRDRNTQFKQEYGRKGVSGVDFKRVLLSMMDSLKSCEPINDLWGKDGSWTFVNEEGEKNGYVSGVNWDAGSRQVVLSEDAADAQNYDARFRASVVVDVPKS